MLNLIKDKFTQNGKPNAKEITILMHFNFNLFTNS